MRSDPLGVGEQVDIRVVSNIVSNIPIDARRFWIIVGREHADKRQLDIGHFAFGQTVSVHGLPWILPWVEPRDLRHKWALRIDLEFGNNARSFAPGHDSVFGCERIDARLLRVHLIG